MTSPQPDHSSRRPPAPARLPVRVIDFVGTVYPESDTLGLYEWASGLILLNIEHEAIKGLDATIANDRWIMQTASHEVAHLLQACMSPFVAEWQSKLFMTVTYALHDAVGGTDFGDDLYALGLEALSRRSLDPDSDTHQGIRQLFDQIEAPGRYGISVRSLIEAHATFIEFRTHIPQAGARKTFASWVSEQDLPTIYRAPHDLVRFACGDGRADEVFPALVGLSLSTTDPVQTFAVVLNDLRRRTDIESSAELIDAYLGGRDLSDVTASRTLANLGTGAHPVLEHRSQRLSSYARDWFLAPWQVMDGDGLRALDPVVVFRPNEDAGIPLLTVNPESRESWVSDPDHEERAWVPYLMLLASLLKQSLAEHRIPQPEVTSWLAEVRDGPLIAHVRGPDDIPKLVETLQQQHARPERCRNFGRLAFVFAAEDDPRPDGLIPWVRESVAAIRHAFPMIGFYLDCTSAHPEQLLVWLTALSPRAASRGDGALDMNHVGALEALQDHLLGLIDEGNVLGYDTELIVANVLARMPDEIAEALTAATKS